MRYVLLGCDRENLPSESEQQKWVGAAYTAFQDEMEARSVLSGRERLRPTSNSTTVRVRDAGLVEFDAARVVSRPVLPKVRLNPERRSAIDQPNLAAST
jgi:hypothetical protein